MKERNLQVEHSLLQKAVRRGNVDVVEKVVNYLLSQDDSKWLHKRLPVMIYEECWPLGNQITSGHLLDQYVTLAQSVKNKDVAGLAALAVKYKEGDWSACRGTKAQRDAITSVKNAIDNSETFWKWAKETGKSRVSRIEAAKVSVTKASFATDKAMMLVAAYFSAKDEVPLTTPAQSQQNPDFPYWIAFDKHTNAGKEIIMEACEKINVLPSRGMQLAFYLEGAKCNQMTASPYWYLAKGWQLDHMKYTATQSDIAWNRLKPVIMQLTKKKADDLKERIEEGAVGADKGDDQLPLI